MNNKIMNIRDAEEHYSDESFFVKIRKYAFTAGRTIIHKAFLLYYTLKDDTTPKWAKSIIYGALGYFVFPLDTIPDFVPVAGFTDDLGALISAIAVVAFYIKDKHKAMADRKIQSLFSEI